MGLKPSSIIQLAAMVQAVAAVPAAEAAVSQKARGICPLPCPRRDNSIEQPEGKQS
jgi:hypothetical protein